MPFRLVAFLVNHMYSIGCMSLPLTGSLCGGNAINSSRPDASGPPSVIVICLVFSSPEFMGIIRIIVSPSPPLSPSPSNPGSPMTNLSSGPSTAPIKTLESASASTSSSDLSVIELDDDRVGSGTNVGVKGKGKGKGMSKGENVGDGRKSKSGGKVVSNGKKRNAPVDSSSFEKPKGAKKAKITNGGGHGDGNGNGEEEKKEKGIYCHQ